MLGYGDGAGDGGRVSSNVGTGVGLGDDRELGVAHALEDGLDVTLAHAWRRRDGSAS